MENEKNKEKPMGLGERIADVIMGVFLLAMVIGVFLFFGALMNRGEKLKESRATYIFPDGLKPIAITRDYDGFYNDIWLCEDATGQYIECSPQVIQQEGE